MPTLDGKNILKPNTAPYENPSQRHARRIQTHFILTRAALTRNQKVVSRACRRLLKQPFLIRLAQLSNVDAGCVCPEFSLF